MPLPFSSVKCTPRLEQRLLLSFLVIERYVLRVGGNGDEEMEGKEQGDGYRRGRRCCVVCESDFLFLSCYVRADPLGSGNLIHSEWD